MPEKNVFNKARRSVKRNEAQLRQVRVRGYKALDQAIDNMYGQLLSGQRGRVKSLTRAQRRDTSKIRTLVANMRQANRRTTNAYEGYASALGQGPGGMMSGEYNRIGRTTQVGAITSGQVGKAGVKQAQGQQRAAAGVANIMNASAREQHAAAEYQASSALSQRTTEDTALIAQQEHEIAMAEMQSKIAEQQAQADFQRSKKLALFNQKVAEGSVANGGQLRTAVDTMIQIGTTVREMADQGSSQDEIKTAIANMFQNDELTGTEWTRINSMVNRLTTDTRKNAPDNVAAEIMTTVRGIPGWEKANAGAITKWVTNSFRDYQDYYETAAHASGADPTKVYGKSWKAAEKNASTSGVYKADHETTAREWASAQFMSSLSKVAPPNSSREELEDLVADLINGENVWENDDLNDKLAKAAKETYYNLPDQVRRHIDGEARGSGPSLIGSGWSANK